MSRRQGPTTKENNYKVKPGSNQNCFSCLQGQKSIDDKTEMENSVCWGVTANGHHKCVVLYNFT